MPLAETAAARIGYGALTRPACQKTGSAFDAGGCLTRGHSTAEGATGGCAEHQLSPKASGNPARRPEWLLGDPLGGDGITSWEGFFYGFVDQLLLALIQIFTRNPVTRCAVGGPVWIGLSRAAFLLRVRSSLIRHDSLLKLWHRTRMLPGNGQYKLRRAAHCAGREP